MLDNDFEDDCKRWLITQIETLTDEKHTITVSEWAEDKRYLPPSVTSMPGFYSYDVFPFLREIADCFSLNSEITQVAIMKGAQVGASVGIIENAIGYEIEHVKTSPCMLVTADAELAQTVLETRIMTMLRTSELDHLIMASDEKNTRKTGRTSKKLEWKGGGFLLPLGANNPGKLRSMSISRLYFDEIDGFKDRLKNEGSPIDLAVKRTANFEETRKIAYISTPLIAQTSKISPLYEMGDQRHYYVPCVHCKTYQTLKFQAVADNREKYGLIFEVNRQGDLIESSVMYVCKHCGGTMQNHDKTFMLKHGEWRATAQPKQRNFRSYHLSSLYSPPGMQSWVELCRHWLDAWDEQTGKPKDLDKMQTFYNLVLGRPFEQRGEALRLEQVVMHRRSIYNSGEIPNIAAINETGAPIQLLTCAVDVHKTHLDIQVIGWCDGNRFYSIEWHKIEGTVADLNSDNSPWNFLRDLIEHKTYEADDGKLYRIQTTIIDAGYSPEPDTVYKFCSDYAGGVIPIMGRDLSIKNANFKEFSPYVSQTGVTGYNVTVTIYKDRLAASLRREWFDADGLQPQGYPNFPQDYPDQFFKELTAESKKEKINTTTGQRMGFVWFRPSGAANHSWDLTVYCWAGLDMVILETCRTHLNQNFINHRDFWELCKTEKLFYTEPE